MTHVNLAYVDTILNTNRQRNNLSIRLDFFLVKRMVRQDHIQEFSTPVVDSHPHFLSIGKGEEEDTAKEIGLDAHLDATGHEKWENAKRDEMIEFFLDSGFDLNGKVPQIMKN